jgi:hypothetical protein
MSRSPFSPVSLISHASLACALGCSSSSSSTPVDAAAAQDAADASDAADAIPFDAAGCTAMRTPAAAPTCGDTCDVRLLLPGGDKYCTMQCAKDADCVPLGAGLVCPTSVGTCLPACTGDAPCLAAGFKRCDTAVGACDTI